MDVLFYSLNIHTNKHALQHIGAHIHIMYIYTRKIRRLLHSPKMIRNRISVLFDIGARELVLFKLGLIRSFFQNKKDKN